MFRRFKRDPSLLGLIAVAAPWAATHLALAFLTHRRLETNAFDLSVFDYALWSLSNWRLGDVPFMGHSLFSHHFMPTLALLVPAYAAHPSPESLLVLQTAAVLAAAVLLWRIGRRSLSTAQMTAVVGAFLFSRQSYLATTSYFYIESFEPLLVFALVLAWRGRQAVAYWTLLLLALGCKEDMALYMIGFGILVAFSGHRRLGASTTVLSLIWLTFALTTAIPVVRSLDGLPTENPFLAARYDASGKGVLLAAFENIVSVPSLVSTVRVSISVLGLCWLNPTHVAVAVPGVLLNLASRPGQLQSGLVGHYVWPVLPWLYLAAIGGIQKMSEWRPRLGQAAAWMLILATIAGSPLWRIVPRLYASGSPRDAAVIREQLRLIPGGASVAAMPNLIPHISHRKAVTALGRELPRSGGADYVALSLSGDLWPWDVEKVRTEIRAYSTNPHYRVVQAGPLFLFHAN